MAKEQNKESQPVTKKSSHFNNLENKFDTLPTTPKQLRLDVGIRIEKSIDGVEMGVLENGLPYLTQRGWQGLLDQSIQPFMI